MESRMYQNLRKLINIVDELRDVGLQQYINLPRICVVGTQSSGKSSVLESIVGLDFLPRGEGVVTRRPTELRLVHLPEAEHKLDEAWASFEGNRGKKVCDFEEVRKEIYRLTDEVAGKNKGIIDSPIILSVHATQCPDLTIIDLPGITRVPLKGSDQTDDIERLTRDMAMRYAKDPRTIVLAVIPANADMSTSDALHLARRVDPKGVRTIGVITKIDLMDRGTDAAKMLMGEEIPLRLGYTGLKNRSQADIADGKTIAKAIEDEKEFFANHPIYRTLPPGVCGVNSLVDKLTKVLFRQIKSFLPDIRKEINNRMRGVTERLNELGEGVPLEVAERTQLLWTMINDYCEIFKNTIRGKYDKRLQTYFEHQDITGGAEIRTIFNELLEEFVDKNVTADMEDHDIDSAIRMHEGDSLPGFPSPDTFEYLILPHLKKIHIPVLDCLDQVTQSLDQLSQRIANRVFGRFPLLAEQVLELSQNILLREKDGTRVILENTVMSETGYLFTNDFKYLTNHGSMINNQEKSVSPSPGNGQQMLDGRPVPPNAPNYPVGTPGYVPQLTPQERAQQALTTVQQSVSNLWQTSKEKKKTRYSVQFIKEIRQRLDAYFNIVLRNVRDSVPKTVGYFLVRQLQEKMQFELYSQLNNETKFADLLGEPRHIMEERGALNEQLNTLKRASQVLQRDPTIACLNLNEIDDTYDRDLQNTQLPIENITMSDPSGGRGEASLTNGIPNSSQALRSPGNNRPGNPNTSCGGSPSTNPPNHQSGNDGRRGSNADMFGGSDKQGGSSQKHLFEKEPVRRQPLNNPLFND